MPLLIIDHPSHLPFEAKLSTCLKAFCLDKQILLLTDYCYLKFWLRVLCSLFFLCSCCFLQIFSSNIAITSMFRLLEFLYHCLKIWTENSINCAGSGDVNVKRSYGILYLWDKFPFISARWEARGNLCSQSLFCLICYCSYTVMNKIQYIKSSDLCQVWQTGFKLLSICHTADNNCFFGQHDTDMFSLCSSQFKTCVQWIIAIFWSFAVHTVSESVAVIFFDLGKLV